MFLVTATMHLKADKRDEALAAIATARAATLQEDGCISYRFFTAADDPQAGMMFEFWRDAEAIAAHGAQPHLAALGQALRDCLDERVEVKRYEVPDPEPAA